MDKQKISVTFFILIKEKSTTIRQHNWECTKKSFL